MHQFIEFPRTGEVYNLGGGRENSISILEAFAEIENISGKPMIYEYVETHRSGSHLLYIGSNEDTKPLSKMEYYARFRVHAS